MKSYMPPLVSLAIALALPAAAQQVRCDGPQSPKLGSYPETFICPGQHKGLESGRVRGGAQAIAMRCQRC